MSAWFEKNKAWLQTARTVWSPRNPEPLRLRGWLSGDIAWDGYDPITLEGTLQCGVVLRETGDSPFDVFSDCPRDEPLQNRDIQIPIVDIEAPDSPCPIALSSHAQFSPDAVENVRAQRARPRAENYRASKVNTAEGQTKAVNGKVATVTAAYIEVFAIGDPELLRVLLTDCGAIGRSRGGGIGMMRGWEILPWETKDPKAEILAMRTMPFDQRHPGLKAGTAGIRFATLRAPYWHQSTRVKCVVPIQTVGAMV